MSIAESFGRSGFARFINSPAGRITRTVDGIVLIVLGYTVTHWSGIRNYGYRSCTVSGWGVRSVFYQFTFGRPNKWQEHAQR